MSNNLDPFLKESFAEEFEESESPYSYLAAVELFLNTIFK